jgi:hypothetical protein
MGAALALKISGRLRQAMKAITDERVSYGACNLRRGSK